MSRPTVDNSINSINTSRLVDWVVGWLVLVGWLVNWLFLVGISWFWLFWLVLVGQLVGFGWKK